MKYCFILGTRPEIIKMYSCLKYCEEHGLDYFILHTNQHYSKSMDQVFFDELNLTAPKYNLNINQGGHGEMTGKMMIEIESVLKKEVPQVVFVQGDTNTVLAGSLVATKMGMKLVHIEAGLRSYDTSMPEEINRICTDHISDFLFTPTLKQKEILIQENINDGKIFVVGNTIVDAVYDMRKVMAHKFLDILRKYNAKSEEYILLTTHRPSNVDNKEALQSILETVQKIGNMYGKKILFPIHPRTRNSIHKFKLNHLLSHFIHTEPIGFIENIALQSQAFLIITDSGGIQEEACILRKKTLILRNNTERPETLEVGGALLVGNNADAIIHGFDKLLAKNVSWTNPFGDGSTAKKIFGVLGNNNL